jgi:hypothetical protein
MDLLSNAFGDVIYQVGLKGGRRHLDRRFALGRLDRFVRVRDEFLESQVWLTDGCGCAMRSVSGTVPQPDLAAAPSVMSRQAELALSHHTNLWHSTIELICNDVKTQTAKAASQLGTSGPGSLAMRRLFGVAMDVSLNSLTKRHADAWFGGDVFGQLRQWRQWLLDCDDRSWYVTRTKQLIERKRRDPKRGPRDDAVFHTNMMVQATRTFPLSVEVTRDTLRHAYRDVHLEVEHLAVLERACGVTMSDAIFEEHVRSFFRHRTLTRFEDSLLVWLTPHRP